MEYYNLLNNVQKVNISKYDYINQLDYNLMNNSNDDDLNFEDD